MCGLNSSHFVPLLFVFALLWDKHTERLFNSLLGSQSLGMDHHTCLLLVSKLLLSSKRIRPPCRPSYVVGQSGLGHHILKSRRKSVVVSVVSEIIMDLLCQIVMTICSSWPHGAWAGGRDRLHNFYLSFSCIGPSA